MSWFVDCVHCGRQVLIDEPASKCYWCGENATKKEAKVMVTPDERARFEAMNLQDRGKWLEDHMKEIVADIRSMPRGEVLEKWPFSQSTLYSLMRTYTPELIGKSPSKPRKVKDETPLAVAAAVADKEDPGLTEHEELIWLRGYRQAAREFLSKGGRDGTS